MSDKDILGNLLATLGSTHQEVAEKLGVEACYGFKGNAMTCPVANYINSRMLSAMTVSRVWVRGDFGEMLIPAAVRDFTFLFDHGNYSHLEATPSYLSEGDGE